MTDFIPYYYLGSDRCHVTRKGQQWTCLGNRIENGFHKKWFIGFSLANKGWVHLINVHDEQRNGRFVVYGTDDTLCSNRKTGKNVYFILSFQFCELIIRYKHDDADCEDEL